MDFPITELMDEDACYQKLMNWLHPDGLACPRCGLETQHELAYAGRLLVVTTCTRCGHTIERDVRARYVADLLQYVGSRRRTTTRSLERLECRCGITTVRTSGCREYQHLDVGRRRAQQTLGQRTRFGAAPKHDEHAHLSRSRAASGGRCDAGRIGRRGAGAAIPLQRFAVRTLLGEHVA